MLRSLIQHTLSLKFKPFSSKINCDYKLHLDEPNNWRVCCINDFPETNQQFEGTPRGSNQSNSIYMHINLCHIGKLLVANIQIKKRKGRKRETNHGMYLIEKPLASTRALMRESGTFLFSSFRISEIGRLIPDVGKSSSGGGAGISLVAIISSFFTLLVEYNRP